MTILRPVPTPVHRRHPDTADGGPVGLLTIADALAPHAASWPGMSRPHERCWALMATDDTFEAWVIAWPSGGAVELHDHGDSAGAVVVVQGSLTETTVTCRPDGTAGAHTETIPTGGSVKFGSRHVHDIVNLGPVPAISVHVYGPRLTSMTYYRLRRNALQTGRTVRYHLGAEVPDERPRPCRMAPAGPHTRLRPVRVGR